jgi:acetylornithine/N-succinyldiaminopimelate aminotransferase
MRNPERSTQCTCQAPEALMSHLIWFPGHELLLGDVVRAEGCSVYDHEGRRYLDLESGAWCTSVGHGHPSVISVLARQAAAVAHTGLNYSAPVVEEAAAEVLSLLGYDGGRCVFLCSGSEAVEFAVRSAQTALTRPRLLTMRDSYFGAYGSAHRRHPHEWFDFD